MYRSINGELLPEYAYLYFSSPRGKYDLGIASPGGAGRNKTLGQDEFKRLEISVPPIEHQQQAVSVVRSWSHALEIVEALIQARKTLGKGLSQKLMCHQRRFPGFANGWIRRRVEDVCEIVYGKSPKGVSSVHGQIPVVGTGGIVGRSRHFLFDKPSIILGRKGSIDKPFFSAGPFWATDTTFYTKIFDGIDFRWLYHRFRAIPWRKYNEASGVPSLSRETVYKIRIEVPDPKEQRAIAALLDAVELGLNHLLALHNKLEIQRQGLLEKLTA